VRLLGQREDNRIELTIHEGRNRQIRRMVEAIGHRVRRLERVAFGPLELGDMRVGRARRLTRAEIAALTGTEE
jgi:23S rRNA pseudouridine2605 synthase